MGTFVEHLGVNMLTCCGEAFLTVLVLEESYAAIGAFGLLQTRT